MEDNLQDKLWVKWLVMPFGLSNAPNTFMILMNEVLRDFIGKFVIFFLDDILIFSQIEKENLEHLRCVLEKLKKENLLVNVKKCTFLRLEFVHLDFVISRDGLNMDPKKVQAITDWPSPRSIFEVKRFHGLASFYRNFINNFSGICSSIIETIKKDKQLFQWTTKAEKRFHLLKKKITEKPILRLPYFKHPFQLKCDSSGVVIGAILSQ